MLPRGLLPVLAVAATGLVMDAHTPYERVGHVERLDARLAGALMGMNAWIARREGQPMSDEQRALLQRWGYAHVLSQWRFHMTLTDTLADEAQRRELVQRARLFFAPALDAELPCDALCVFVEPAPGEPFVLAHRLPLADGA